MRFFVTTAVRIWCRWAVSHRLRVDVEGLEHVPRKGPVLIVSRHVHHLYDGVIYLAILRRTPSILVALDWIPKRWLRLPMEIACGAAGWPVVLREDRLRPESTSVVPPYISAYALPEAHRYLRNAVRRAVGLLRRGKVLIVFPEAYPKIDPMASPRHPGEAFLPFRRGFVHLVRNAQRAGGACVRVVPAGLCYEGSDPYQVHVRFGPALTLENGQSSTAFALKVEEAVQDLSAERKTQYADRFLDV